jgi:hypothetical protein
VIASAIKPLKALAEVPRKVERGFESQRRMRGGALVEMSPR